MKQEPELRFPDFSGEWVKWKLGDIAKKIITKNRDLTISLVLTNSAKFGITPQRDFFDKDIANKEALSNYYVVEKDDFVYNPRLSKEAPVGPIKRNHIALGVVSPLYTVFRVTKGDKTFLEYLFETTKWHRYMEKISNYGARHDRMNIRDEDFFNMPLYLPPTLSEQQRIASFLSSIDKKIDLTSQKLEKLNENKKGLLQKLFPRDKEKEPTLRFPDFSGGWVEKRLGEVAEFYKGRGLSKKDILKGGKSECLLYGELYTQYSETIKEIKSRTNLDIDNKILL